MFKKRRLKRTCPRCLQRTLTRIERREALGALHTITRFCISCEYSDGYVSELRDLEGKSTEDRLVQAGTAYSLPHAYHSKGSE